MKSHLTLLHYRIALSEKCCDFVSFRFSIVMNRVMHFVSIFVIYKTVPPRENSEQCVDSPGWVDKYGRDCADWEQGGWCADIGDNLFFFDDAGTANAACCACGGGTNVNVCDASSHSRECYH